MSIVLAGTLIGSDQVRWVAMEEDRVAEVGRGRPPKESLQIGPALLAPGFIDLQVNGVEDIDFGSAPAAEFTRAREILVSHGVTGFLPTLVTMPLGSYEKPLEQIAEAWSTAIAGDSILGVHLEGPFLGGFPGAHRHDLLRQADTKWLSKILHSYGDLIRIVTLAPESDPDLEATRLLAGAGILVSLGHSNCSYEESRAAADAGARAVTHLFNAMAPMHHREPGLAGAALDDERLTPTLIADLLHVHPAALRLAMACKSNVALVTDSIATTSAAASTRGIRLDGGVPRLSDGTIAGTSLFLDQAVRNLVSIGVPLGRAVESASTVPAALLGLSDRGEIAPGRRADIVAIDPEDLKVLAVWIEGELTYRHSQLAAV